MLVEFTLTMEDLVVNGESIDLLIMQWVSEVDQEEIMEVSHRWITTQDFLTRRMIGLTRVGESSLCIEPLGDMPNLKIPL